MRLFLWSAMVFLTLFQSRAYSRFIELGTITTLNTTPSGGGTNPLSPGITGDPGVSGFSIYGGYYYTSGSDSVTINISAVFSSTISFPAGPGIFGAYLEGNFYSSDPSAELSEFSATASMNGVTPFTINAINSPVTLGSYNDGSSIANTYYASTAYTTPVFEYGGGIVTINLDISITFSNLLPGDTVGFFLPGGGNYTAVPEPAPLAMLGTAAITFAGYFGWPRRKRLATA